MAKPWETHGKNRKNVGKKTSVAEILDVLDS